MRVLDEIQKCIVYLGSDSGRGFVAYGTGFIVGWLDGQFRYHTIVTARHVLDEIAPQEVLVRINRNDGTAQECPFPRDLWIPHSDDAVDLATAPCSFPLSEFDYRWFALPDSCLTDTALEAHSIGPGDEVFLAGLYTSEHGHDRNVPIVRVGTIAAMPGEPIWAGRDYQSAYLAEVKSLGGLSGSPVFVYVPPYRTKEDGVVGIGSDYQYFIGVMLGHHTTSNPTDAIFVTQMGDPVETDEARIELNNTGIAVVLPWERVIEFQEHPSLKHQVDEAKRVAELNQKLPTAEKPPVK